jgi:hypothetical protein
VIFPALALVLLRRSATPAAAAMHPGGDDRVVAAPGG